MTTRRVFLRGAAAGAAALMAGRGVLAQTETPMPGMSMDAAAPTATPGPAASAVGAFVPDAEVSLTAVDKLVQILPGAKTRVWGYEAKLMSGSGVTILPVEGSYLGPIMHIQSGIKLRIVLKNGLQEKTVLHPHGLRVPEDCDGQPMQAIGPGQTKVYQFPVIDRAGPYWFHPHPMGRTAEQVVMGLAGAFFVHDADEAAAIPGAATGANDVPVIIQDRQFNANNQFLYQPNMMWGYLGDRILVNGQPDAAMTLEPRPYRLRLLNGSNARTYKLAWSNSAALTVIGTDGGLLAAAEAKPYVMLMPGERVDLWADFATLAGQKVVLRSLAWDAGMMGGMGSMQGMGGMMGSMQSMGGGMGMGGMGGMGMMGRMQGMQGSALANGAAFDVLTINVGQKASSQPALGKLPALPFKYAPADVSNFASPRTFSLAMAMMMNWTINGRVYEDMAVAPDERVKLGATEAWEWVNNSPIPHPMHVHNVQFQVMSRTSPGGAAYAGVADGFVNSGLKDTVAVWPGERVKVAMKFGPHAGLYMYHCHILEHEDMTMMRNYRIEA